MQSLERTGAVSFTIDSIIFDGESFSAVLMTETGKVTYTVPRGARQSLDANSGLLDRAKLALIRRLADAAASPPKGGHHFFLTEVDLADVSVTTERERPSAA